MTSYTVFVQPTEVESRGLTLMGVFPSGGVGLGWGHDLPCGESWDGCAATGAAQLRATFNSSNCKIYV
jgi:hypothetical protein